jgi:hypothetical protein
MVFAGDLNPYAPAILIFRTFERDRDHSA